MPDAVDVKVRLRTAIDALMSAIDFAVIIEESDTVTPLQAELLKALLAAKEAHKMLGFGEV